MTFPITYRLLAIHPSQINLRAKTFGERYCHDYWNWHYLWNHSIPITTHGQEKQAYLPSFTPPAMTSQHAE